MSNRQLKSDHFLTTHEAAKYLRLKKNTLEIWRVQGRGPEFVKFGRLVRYRFSALENYVSTCTHNNTSQYGLTPSS